MFAPCRFAPARFAYAKSAYCRLAPCRLAPWRFAPKKWRGRAGPQWTPFCERSCLLGSTRFARRGARFEVRTDRVQQRSISARVSRQSRPFAHLLRPWKGSWAGLECGWRAVQVEEEAEESHPRLHGEVVPSSQGRTGGLHAAIPAADQEGRFQASGQDPPRETSSAEGQVAIGAGAPLPRHGRDLGVSAQVKPRDAKDAFQLGRLLHPVSLDSNVSALRARPDREGNRGSEPRPTRGP